VFFEFFFKKSLIFATFFCTMGIRRVFMITIQEIKQHLKTKGITYQELSDMSNIPLNTLKNLFRGKTQNPRVDTMEAIEKALGITPQEPPQQYTEEEKQLLDLIMQLNDDEVQELSNFVDYIISKRK
jgi:transcriptional regulator with XRE-family HTH domain